MNHTIVITGANRGIGLELAKLAALKGHRVIATARSAEKAAALKEAVGSKGAVLSLDIAKDESVTRFASSLKELGVTAVDILINNAGVYLDDDVAFESLDSKMILESFNTNSIGPIRVTQALLPLLKKARAPKVASVSSLMGSMADNKAGGAYAYRMSKAAVNMFTRSLAADEREMTVITLHPGWVKTDMGGDRAPLEPAKSAEGLWTVIESATPDDSGKFFNHAGRELPW